MPEPSVARGGNDLVDDGWRARLELRLAHDGERTRVVHRRHEGPLVVQKTFHPGGADPCQVVLVHPPGGVVGGDRIGLDVELHPEAQALITTPGATKFYRSNGREARQISSLRAAAGALLEWAPQETIVFDGARVRIDTKVDLEPGARFIGWEIVALGRPACRERFSKGRCRQRFEIHRDGRPIWLDRTDLAGGGEALEARWGQGGFSASGVLVADWPEGVPDAGLMEHLVGDDPGGPLGAVDRVALQVGATRVGDLAVVRVLGPQARPILNLFTALRAALRAEIAPGPAPAARIWAT